MLVPSNHKSNPFIFLFTNKPHEQKQKNAKRGFTASNKQRPPTDSVSVKEQLSKINRHHLIFFLLCCSKFLFFLLE